MTTASKTRPQKLVFKRTAQNPGLSFKEKPTMATMAKSLLDAAGQILKKGVKRVSKKEKARRLEICRTCTHLESGGTKFERCQKCGCVLAFKSALEAWGCPEGKW
tara:strand:+ start:308 stop:622 length:315 start_codon:yes stop_codon:yes gene_type:complete